MVTDVCDLPSHEWSGNERNQWDEGAGCWRRVGSVDDPEPELDRKTHRVTILGPAEAAQANENPLTCCSGCAVKLATAYVGFGWDVTIARR